MKDLLYDTFFCDVCGNMEDKDRMIIRGFDEDTQAYFPTPIKMCYECAIRKEYNPNEVSNTKS